MHALLAAQSIYKDLTRACLSGANCCQLAIPEDSALPFNDRFAWLPKHLAKLCILTPVRFYTTAADLLRQESAEALDSNHTLLVVTRRQISLVHRIRKRLLRQGWQGYCISRMFHPIIIFARSANNTMAVWLYKIPVETWITCALTLSKMKGSAWSACAIRTTRHAEDPWVNIAMRLANLVVVSASTWPLYMCESTKEAASAMVHFAVLITGKPLKFLVYSILTQSNSLRMFFKPA